MYFVGIDVGTQGARVVACDLTGRVAAHAEEPLPMPAQQLAPGWAEQQPAGWWAAAAGCLLRVTAVIDRSAVAGVSVTSTSGSVCLADASGEPLGPAIMYNDGRAQPEAEEVQAAGEALAAKLGYRFTAFFALPRLLWLRRHSADNWARASYFLSPTDFIIGRLTGDFRLTDYSNALKTGYDLVDERWPEFVGGMLGLPSDRLPRVVAPGTFAGHVTAQAAAATGLAEGTPVLAGMTDGCASQVSTGAVRPGQWNSTLGTTLVLKGVTRSLLCDPEGRVYCHRHPDGYWLPGGASNTGGEAITQRFRAERLSDLNAAALDYAPTDVLVYPLARKGERFPFNRAEALGFVVGHALDEATLYTAHLEGVAYVERLAYDVLVDLGAEMAEAIYIAGGATASGAWLQLRADILGKTLMVPEDGGAAKGAAVVAASGVHFGSLAAAAEAMVRVARRVTPRAALRDAYDERYARFCEACRERGYLRSVAAEGQGPQ